jgi:hypothetical protein
MRDFFNLISLSSVFEKLATSPREAFSILGLPFGVNKNVIKRKYKELVNQYHPDKAPEDSKKSFTKKLVEINSAYPLALENAGSYSSSTSEESEIERLMLEREKEGFVSHEEMMEYGDWMEENPKEYERRKEEAFQQITQDVKGARYKKTKIILAERAMREIDFAQFFFAVH